MRTRDIRTDDGSLMGFSVSNLFLSRYGIPRILARIPGARLIRSQRRLGLAQEDFCQFEVAGKNFLVIETFNDSSVYEIVAVPPEPSAQLDQVRSAFEKHRVLFGAFHG